MLWEVDSIFENLEKIDNGNKVLKILRIIISALFLGLNKIIDSKVKSLKIVSDLSSGMDMVYKKVFMMRKTV